ncbi:uncharacterized protein LOC130736826 [Lotus japonicus]|uniref:uncharacterized protein LOC130736826 n=1 Tax=Lotus japonicus TaxID=34305 RepID=UPI00258DAD1F|nr:uncharacterized protein LOC130736826 [Lotus japonicus]
MQRDWAHLDAIALDLVLDKLEERIDHVWFGLVCKNWCSVAKLNHQSKQFRTSSVLPMLMIRTKTRRGRRKIKTSLFSIPGNRVYPFLSPWTIHTEKRIKICGSSHGWLAVVAKASSLSWLAEHAICLINPLKDVDNIALPMLRTGDVKRVVLSVDPLTNPNNYVVAVTHYGSRNCRLAFIRAGQELWTYAKMNRSLIYRDITFYRGLIYVVCDNVVIVSFNLDYSDDPYGREKIIPHIIYENNGLTGTPKRVYVVKSLEGDLWLVRRFLEGFDVYKLELDAQYGKVLQMLKLDNLGDNVLFVGDHGDSTVASFSYFSNSLQKDSIYYYENGIDETPNIYPHGPFDLRVYNVKEGRLIQQYPLNPSFKRVPPLLWILPQFQWD